MATETSNVITLKGSCDIVKEFFHYSVNSILYQRGVYPPESFRRVQNYGLTMLVTADEKLEGYLEQVLRQLGTWLLEGRVSQVVCVIKGVESGETLERWVFDVEAEREEGHENSGAAGNVRKVSDKDEKEVKKEIRAIIRQITSSVTFLPMLQEACAFDLLVYADKDAQVPLTWEDTDPHMIRDEERADVQLRSFSTKIHKVDTMVSYREAADL